MATSVNPECPDLGLTFGLSLYSESKIQKVPMSFTAKLPSRTNYVDEVYKVLLDAISDGSLAPGTRVTQEELAEQLDVSRSPVIQALRQLKTDGLVQDAPGRGLLIAPLEPQTIGHVYKIRGVLDELAAGLAAERRAKIDPDVIRKGRVQGIEPDRLVLDGGVEAMPTNTLYVDCTASAVEPRAVQPIFQPDKIVLQVVRIPLPTFSAALIAYVEAHYEGDQAKNRLCASVPFPNRLEDYPRTVMVSMWNQGQWAQDKTLRNWIRESRLDGFGKLMTGIAPQDTEKLAVIAQLREQAMAAMANLPKLIAATNTNGDSA